MGASVRLEGAGRLTAKLNKRRFLIEPTRDTLRDLNRFAVGEVKKRAPRERKGRIEQAVESRIDRRDPPRFDDVVMKAVTNEGFRLNFALDAARHRAENGQGAAKKRQKTPRGAVAA